MFADGFCVLAESLVALGGNELLFEVSPALNLVLETQNAPELVWVEVGRD